MRRDCLDTDALIALTKTAADPEQADPALRGYLQELEEGKHTVVIPTPVVTEYLTGLPENKWEEALQIFNTFEVYDLNLQASIEAAKMLRRKLEKEGKLGGNQERQCVRTDAFILGIAIVQKCERIFSMDSRIENMADGKIQVERSPEPDQPTLL